MQYNDTLYINGYYLTRTKWYAKVESQGRFILIYSALPGKTRLGKEMGLEEEYKKLMQKGMMAGFGGLLGAALSTSIDAPGALDRYPIIYDITRDKAYYPNETHVRSLIADFPGLQEKYAHWKIELLSKKGVMEFVEDLNRAYALSEP